MRARTELVARSAAREQQDIDALGARVESLEQRAAGAAVRADLLTSASEELEQATTGLEAKVAEREDGDLLGRVVAELEAGFDHPSCDDVDAGVRDDRHHHRDLVHPGLLQHELRQAACLRDRGVPTDLAVVRRAAAMGAHGIEQRQRASAGADHESEVAVELGDVAGHAAVVLGVDGLACKLERRGLARLARLLLADAEVGEQLSVPSPGLVLDVHVGVQSDERAVCEPPQGVDLGEDHVVLDEQLRQAADDRHEPVERRPRDTGGGDHLLGLEVAEGQDVGEVAAADGLGLLLGDLLDVDAADRREDHHRLLAGPVPDDPRVVLLLDLGPGVDEHAAGHLPVDLQLQDVAGVGFGLLGRVGELDTTRLHAPAAEDLRLDDGRARRSAGRSRRPRRRRW